MQYILSALCLLLCSTIGLAREGVDFSSFEGEFTQKDLDCLAANNKTFAIVEIWKHQWGINKYWLGYYEALQKMNFEFVDAYAFICNGCEGNTPKNICSSINETLPADFKGKLWIDVEPCDGCWSSNFTENMQFVVDVIDTCTPYGWQLGIYSTKYCWSEVVGEFSAPEKLTNLPLWFAHWDNSSNFNDYEKYSVGNWTHPIMKQKSGLASLCGLDIDLDYLPDILEEIITY